MKEFEMAKRFIEFAKASPSPFHAIDNIRNELSGKGFIELFETSEWNIKPAGRYFVTRNNSSVIAFTIPADGFSSFQIIASHSDSPCFKLKPVFEDKAVGNAYLRLNVERYGGMIMSTWLDRPLSVAGRIIYRNGNELVEKNVYIDRDCMLIPNMPIHFNREVNTGYNFNPQVDLLPLYGYGEDSGKLYKEIADVCGIDAENIVDADLFLCSRLPGTIWGAENQFFSAGHIDDLECAWVSLKAFLNADIDNHHCNMYCVFDNEEVGSNSKQGADSDFLANTVTRISAALGKSSDDMCRCISSSFMVSADNAHAVHPNHPEKFDAQNRTYMNKGIVIKHNSAQKYTTDAVASAVFADICKKADVPVQHFSNRSDLAGGSTLGNIANTHVSMNTVDIGLPQLAMHSSYETAGTMDIVYAVTGLTAFYNSEIVFKNGKSIVIE
ncbi:MAG: M18 family aminopeptidase [Clostridiales bacterium]|nr:M18 family aminopeptidase [Clostridiales bacterium]